MQICRRSYEVKDKETGNELEVDNAYIMSPKDLKTIHFLNKLIDCLLTMETTPPLPSGFNINGYLIQSLKQTDALCHV